MLDNFRSADGRYMTGQEPISDALAVLAALEGVRYNDIQAFGNPRRVGLVGQSVKKALPEAVEEDVTGMHYADLAAVVPVLVEAVKLLAKRVEKLEAKPRKRAGDD